MSSKLRIPGLSKKATTVLIMLCIIGAGYAYYFLGYVKSNEIAYNEKAYRILDRIGVNIEKSNSNKQIYLKSKVEAIIDTYIQSDSELKNELNSITTRQDALYSDIEKAKSNNLLNDSEKREKNTFLNQSFDETIEDYYQLMKGGNKNSLNPKPTNYLQTAKEILPKYSVKINSTNTSLNDSIGYSFKIKDIEWTLKMSLEDFMSPILRKDVFDEFIILSKGDSNITYQTFKNKVQIHKTDSLFFYNSAQTTLKNKVIKVGNVNYKVFTYNLSFSSGNNQKQWLIVGCVKNKNYIKEVRSISFWVIINSSLLIMLLLFAMPTLKLVLMNSIERLHRKNVFLTGISIIIGTLFLVLLFLMGINYTHDIIKTDETLDEFSKEVITKIESELNCAYSQLSDYDTLLKDAKPNDPIVTNPQDILSKVSSLPKASSLYPDHYSSFNTVFWVDKTGMQKTKIFPTDKKITKRIPVKERDYFNAANDGNLWQFGKHKIPFYMESTVSWTTGARQLVISKNSEGLYPVVAMATKFKSLIEPVLPIGYEFSIITSDGDILVHSNNAKNLQENFIDESKNKEALITAIYSKTALKTTVNYLGRVHRIKIEPIKGTPLFLIVQHDLSNLKSKISEIWSTSLIFIFISFLMVGLLMLCMNLIRNRSSKLLTKPFFFDWLAPKGHHHKELYKKIIISNLFVILILVAIISYDFFNIERIDILFTLFILPLISFVIIHRVLKSYSSRFQKRFFNFSSLALFLLINFVFHEYVGYKKGPHLLFIGFQLAIVFIFFVNIKFGKWIEKISFGNLKTTFSIFLLSWLMISAIVPIIYFYKISYDMESEIWAKHTLLELSRDLKLQIDTAKNNAPESLVDLYNPKEYQGIYNEFLGIKFKENIDNFNDPKYKWLETIMFHLRPSYSNNAIIKTKGLVFSNASDSTFNWSYKEDSILLTSNLPFKKGGENTIQITHKLNEFNIFKTKKTFPVLFLLILFLILPLALYRIISFCVNKIYGLELSSPSYNIDITKMILNNKTINTILIGLPSSGKTTLINNIFKFGKNTGNLLIDCTTINHTSKNGEKVYDNWNFESYKTIILDNFEYKNDDHETSAKKLRLLEKLQSLNKHIIITSEIEPTEFLDLYRRAIENGHEDELEIWRHIFSNFVETYMPFEQIIPTIDIDIVAVDDTESQEKQNKNIELLQNEIKHGSFLQKATSILGKKIDLKNVEHDDVVLEVQNYAKSYYYALWNSLTKKEQFAIYDIAKDGFMNTTNKRVITVLLKKGLLVYKDNKLDIMNESFKNFVLSVLTNNIIKQMDTEVSKKGKWVNIRLVIILVVVALIILIGFGNPDFFKNINAIMFAVAGVMTVVPTLSRAFSLTQKIK